MQITRTHQDRKEVKELDAAEVIVGRPNPFLPPNLDLSEDTQVSRTHARIWLSEGAYWIEDLASKHGTWVNGVRLEYRRQLYPGDTIQVGSTLLEIAPPTLAGPGEPAEEPKRDTRVAPATHTEGAAASKSHPVYPGSAIQVGSAMPGGGFPPPAKPRELTSELKLQTRVQKAINVEEFEAPRERAGGAATGGAGTMASLAVDLTECEGREQTARLLAERLVRMFPASQRAVVLLRDAVTGALSVAASHPSDANPLSQVMVLRALAEGRALLWRESLESLDAAGVRGQTGACGLYAPMCKRHQPVGVLCVEGEIPKAAFTEADLKQLLAVAGVGALALG